MILMKTRYKLIKENQIIYKGHHLYPIMALYTFNIGEYTVKRGTIGGYIESTNNLSQKDAWIFPHSIVYGNSKIENSIIKSGCEIYNAIIKGSDIEKSTIIGNNKGVNIKSSCVVNATISDEVKIYSCFIYGESTEIFSNALLKGKFPDTLIRNAKIGKDAFITRNGDCIATDVLTLYNCTDNMQRYYHDGNYYILGQGPQNIEKEFKTLLKVE